MTVKIKKFYVGKFLKSILRRVCAKTGKGLPRAELARQGLGQGAICRFARASKERDMKTEIKVRTFSKEFTVHTAGGGIKEGLLAVLLVMKDMNSVENCSDIFCQFDSDAETINGEKVEDILGKGSTEYTAADLALEVSGLGGLLTGAIKIYDHLLQP